MTIVHIVHIAHYIRFPPGAGADERTVRKYTVKAHYVRALRTPTVALLAVGGVCGCDRRSLVAKMYGHCRALGGYVSVY